VPIERFPRAALVRCIAENISQPGRDYAEERGTIKQPTVSEFAAEIAKLRDKSGGSLAPAGAKVTRKPDGRRQKLPAKPPR